MSETMAIMPLEQNPLLERSLSYTMVGTQPSYERYRRTRPTTNGLGTRYLFFAMDFSMVFGLSLQRSFQLCLKSYANQKGTVSSG